MPIVRTYACENCMHMLEVTLSAEQWDDPPPECPRCSGEPMRQEFKPVAIGGSVRNRAQKITDDILTNDYHVSNMEINRHEGETRKVVYKDQSANIPASSWSMHRDVLEGAISAGRQTRLKYGSGLDVLQANLKSGVEPDLIENSKRKMIKLW